MFTDILAFSWTILHVLVVLVISPLGFREDLHGHNYVFSELSQCTGIICSMLWSKNKVLFYFKYDDNNVSTVRWLWRSYENECKANVKAGMSAWRQVCNYWPKIEIYKCTHKSSKCILCQTKLQSCMCVHAYMHESANRVHVQPVCIHKRICISTPHVITRGG